MMDSETIKRMVGQMELDKDTATIKVREKSITEIIEEHHERVFGKKEARPCPNCGKNERVDCGYGKRDSYGEFDCTFPWEDYGISDGAVECDCCPFVFCADCKDDMIAKYAAIRSIVGS